MVKSFQSLMLIMVSLLPLLITLGLIIYLRFLILHLISFVHKLCLQNNAFYYFDAHKFLIQDLPSGKILYKGLSKDGVYRIPSSSTAFNSKSNVSASNSIKSDVLLLWHYRLGHPSSRLLYYALKTFCHCYFVSN